MRTDEEKKKHAAYMREYMRTHPEQRRKQIERTEQYRELDPEIRKREYARNRDTYIARSAAYRASNIEAVREYDRKRYHENSERKADTIKRAAKRKKEKPDIHRAEDARYRERHKAERAAYNSRYFKEHPDVSRQNNHRRRAQKYVAPFERFKSIEIYARDQWICGLCGQLVDKSLHHRNPLSASLDHIIPLSKGGHHVRTNCQLAHLNCNKKKNNRAA